MNEAEIIKGARDILAEPTHWRKGDYTDGSGRYCLLGALGMSHAQALFVLTVELVAGHLPRGSFLGEFNDDEKTTHQDVLDVLDKTLADLGVLGEA